MIEVCRIEKWTVEDGEAVDDIYDELYFLVKVIGMGMFFWFDACLEIIQSPFIGKDYNLRPFGRIINQGVNGTFEATPTEEYDIIYYEEGVMPYNRSENIDYKELLERLLLEKAERLAPTDYEEQSS